MSESIVFSSRMRLVSSGGSVVINDAATDEIIDHGYREEQRAKESYNEAYQSGFETCREEMQASLDAVQAQLNDQVGGLTAQLDEMRSGIPQALDSYFTALEKDIEEQVLDLAFVVAEAILKRELADKASVRETVQQALAPIVNRQGIKLRLHPDNIAEIRSDSRIGLRYGIELVPDADLGLGDAFVECQQGYVDATLPVRLESLRQILDDRRHAVSHDDDTSTPDNT